MIVALSLACTITLATTQGSVSPYFIERCSLWSGKDYVSGRRPFQLGVSDEEFLREVNVIVAAVRHPDFKPDRAKGKSSKSVGIAIKRKVEELFGVWPAVPKATQTARQWLLAEGVCAWVVGNVRFDHELERRLGVPGQGWTSMSQEQLASLTTGEGILGSARPATVCWGIAVTTRDIARAAGLTCDFVNGSYRDLGGAARRQEDHNHGTVCFVLDGKVKVPADVSVAITDSENNRVPFRGKKTHSWCILPLRPEAWELFLASFNGDYGGDAEISGDRQNVYKLLNMSYRDWASRDTSYLSSLRKWLLATEANTER